MESTLGSKNTTWLALIFGALGILNLVQGDWIGAMIWCGLAVGQSIQPPTDRRMRIAYYAVLAILVVAMSVQLILNILL
ncbi:MAG TPA: hypothetical protein PLQ56_17115 [Aggregatilineales bacterium]|nr:hypothetical protein [Aggregatilineales bacterium]